MNWISMVWSGVATACLTLAFVHSVIWIHSRKGLIHLQFAAAALAVALLSVCEMQMMSARTPEQFGTWLRWAHLPVFFAIVAIVFCIRTYLDAGRLWIAWSIVGLRFLILIVNFSTTPNVNFTRITEVQQVELADAITVSIPKGDVRPWTRVAELSLLMLLVFVVDASVTLWRRGTRGDRRRALILGGSMAFFVLIGGGHVALIHAGILKLPYMISPPFLLPVAAMGYELGLDVVRSHELSLELDETRTMRRQDQQQMDLIISVTGLGLWKWDIPTNEIWISAAGRKLCGLVDSAPVNLDRLLDAMHPEDRDRFTQSFADIRFGDDRLECECRIPLPDGRQRWIAGKGRVQFNGQNEPTAVMGVAVDITRIKQAEEHFRVVVDASVAALIVVNSAGIITLVNTQAEKVFGYARSELIGKSFETLIPERFKESDEAYRHLFVGTPQRRAPGAERELFGLRKNGSEVPIELDLTPIRTHEETLLLASVVDLTARRNVEREQMRHRDEVTHLSRVAMLGELSGAIAHELNQPLTAILSNAQAAQVFLAENPADIGEVGGILQDVVEESRRAREVIRRLRELLRKGEVHFETIDLNPLVLEVLKLMRSDLLSREVTVRTRLMNGPANVKGDRVQFQQVLVNLILNASQAMEENAGAPRELRVTTMVEGADTIRVSIADTGCGIPADHLGQVFEPFHTTKSAGVGLGLSICRNIVSAHDGKIWATNNPDKGTSFHITLPSLATGES